MLYHRFRRPLRVGALGVALVAALALGGCDNNADEQRIAELEAQVDELQSQLDDGGTSGGASATQGDATTGGDASIDAGTSGQAQTPTTTAPAPDTTVTANYPEIADFETRTKELEDACAAVTVSSDANANYQTYLDMKMQLDMLDNEMDRYDEQQENAARTGSIAYNDYIQIETAIDVLCDRLDYAEDSMQYALGIYDD